jgi:hypothetical protein
MINHLKNASYELLPLTKHVPVISRIYLKLTFCVDVRGSVRQCTFHKEKSNKMQQYFKILLFHIYKKLNMFWATHRLSSGT